MPDSENVGAINISIGGDYSPLLQAFQDTQNAAATAGKNISDALTQGAASGASAFQNWGDQLKAFENAAIAAGGTVASFDDQIRQLTASGYTGQQAIDQITQSLLQAQTVTASGSNLWSDYTQKLNDANVATETASQQMNLFGDAFEAVPWADATGQLNLFANELEPVAQEAAQAAQGVQQLSTATEAASVPTEKASLSLGDLVKGYVALQGALALTRGIQEFAASALAASDSFTAAQISLTALTGSASRANSEITQLVNLAEQDGLSMPALLTAAVRMQALVGAAAPVPAILAQLANAGAVSGQGIEAAANAFDRMASSGTAAARTLLPLGINLDDLAKSFNSLTGTTEATNLNIGALFKTLSESQRVDVLTDALNKLNGVAKQVADQTFSGQFNQLVAEWSQVMKSAGDALEPLIADLVQFTKTDIVPFAQSVAGTFKDLSSTFVNVTSTIGGLKDKFNELAKGTGDVGTVASLFKGVWSDLLDVIKEYNAYSLANKGLNELALSVQTLLGITPGATAMLSAQTAELAKLQAAGTAAKPAIDLVANAVKELAQADDTASASYKTSTAALSAVNASLLSGTALVKGHTTSLQDQWAALEKVNSAASGIPAALGSVSLALANDTMAAQKSTLEYQAAAGAYQALLAQFNAGAPVQGQLAAAFQKMQQAEQAAAAAGAPVAGSLQAIDEQAIAAVNSSKILATNFGLVADQAKAQTDSLDNLNAAVLVDSQRLDLLVTQEQKVATQVSAGTAQYSQQLQIKQQVASANTKLISDTQALQSAELAMGNAAAAAGGMIAQLEQAQNEANLSLEQAKVKYDAGALSTTAFMSAQKAAVSAAVALAQAVAEQQADMSHATDELGLAGAAAAGAAAKLQVLTQAFKDNQASIADVTSAQAAYISTQVKLSEAQAVAEKGLQGATDAYSLQSIAVAKAAADVDVYTKLEQQGYDVASQLQSAIDALTTAQDKLNGMTTAATADTDALVDSQIKLYGSMGSLVPAMGSVTTGLGNIGTAAKNAVAQLNDVAAAVLGIEADMKAAFGSKTTAGGTITLPDGTQLGGGLLTGAGSFGGQDLSYGIYANAATEAAIVKAQELAMYAAGYTPQAIAKAMADPLANVLANLGIDASKAGQTQSQASGTASSGDLRLGGAAPSGLLPTGSGGGVTSSAPSTTSVASSSSSPGVDGGVYPDVTAHQAAGEIWQVLIAGGSGAGGQQIALGSTVASDNATSALAASSTASAVAQAASSMAVSVGLLQQVSAQAEAAANTITKGVGSGPVQVPTSATGGKAGTGGNSSSPIATGGGGTAAGGTPFDAGIGAGGGFFPVAGVPTNAGPPSIPSGSSLVANTATFQITVDARGNTSGAEDLSAMIATKLVNQLYSSGARLSR